MRDFEGVSRFDSHEDTFSHTHEKFWFSILLKFLCYECCFVLVIWLKSSLLLIFFLSSGLIIFFGLSVISQNHLDISQLVWVYSSSLSCFWAEPFISLLLSDFLVYFFYIDLGFCGSINTYYSSRHLIHLCF